MYENLFSKRYGLRPTPEGLVPEHVPESTRIGFTYVLEPFEVHIDFERLYSRICVALRIPRSVRDNNLARRSDELASVIEDFVGECPGWQFYDICEIVDTYLTSVDESLGVTFAERLNTLLADEQLGFEMRDGKVEKVGSGFLDAQIQEARVLLKGPEFEGADQHFEKALKASNARPDPDVENCVKDAIAALESVGRVILGDDKILLDAAIKELTRRKVIPKPLDQVLAKLNAYRGNEPGVAHGAVDLSAVTPAEADFVLATAAAAIIYLVEKRES